MKFYDIQEPSSANSLDYKTADKSELAIGIDLGTTYSLVAIYDENLRVLSDPSSNLTYLPSAVNYSDNRILVGSEAFNKDDSIISIKRKMGKAIEQISCGDSTLNQIQISADILRKLKEIAEQNLNRPVNKAVITVPAYFDDSARQATKDAAELAGLQVLRLLNEPTAAAVAYGFDTKSEGIYVIYDLGGGTFDVSVLKMTKGVFQVLATGGDHELGGDDFDIALAGHILGIGKINNNHLLAARKIKEHLSSHEQYSGKFLDRVVNITRVQLEELIAGHIKKTIKIVKKCLKEAAIEPSEITEILLVGGSTRTPCISQQLSQALNKQPLNSIDPDKIVALGAAIQARALSLGGGDLLLDVLPLSLGIELGDGTVEKIIHRNTPIPVERKQTYTTSHEGQTGFIIHVLQGEGDKVNQCRSLAKFELNDIPKLSAGMAKLEVYFRVDADGILSVTAQELSTGKKQYIEVKPSYAITEQQMLELLKIGLK